MRKADLIDHVSQKTGVSKIDVLATVETTLQAIQETLATGESIFIRGFGTFSPKKRAAKLGRDIKRGTPVHMREHHIPHFKPAKEFKHKLKHAGGQIGPVPSF